MDRYALACDSCDWDMYRSIFSADCVIDYTEFGGGRGDIDSTVAWLSAGLSRYAGLHHNMTTHDCEIDGDTAKAITYFIAFQTTLDGAGGESMMWLGGFYKDRLVRQADGWRICERIDLGAWLGPPIPERLKNPPSWYGTMSHHQPRLLED